MRANIRVAVQYIEAWISGNGCVPIYGLMEDAATAEISRTSIWQWIHHEKTLSNGKPVTKALFRQMLAEEMLVIQEELGEHRFSSGRFDDAARLMEQITTSDELIDFLTLPGYRLLARPGYFVRHFGPGQRSKPSRTLSTLRFLRGL
jgi:malate synthase